MKVLHLPTSYLPWSVGGKEVYCQTLCRALAEEGASSEVAIHKNPGEKTEPLGRHEHEGVPVHVLPPLPDAGSRQAAYTKTHASLPDFDALLAAVRPDVVHFHDQSGGASLSHLRLVQARGIPTVLTFHSPGQTCPQSSLLRWGCVPCDGEVRLGRCTACRLNFSCVPRPACDVAALAEWPGVDLWSESPVARVLTARTMTRLFRESLREFIARIDAIVVLAEWSRGVWQINGAPDEKLHLVRTGGLAAYTGPRTRTYQAGERLRVACIGRCTWIKGFHVLVEAVKGMPVDAPVEVHFLGPYWGSDYGRDLQRRIANDSRFLLPRLVPHTEMLLTLAEMDVVVIPSLWLETGPLTLFDAFAAGVPVLGSRRGGIVEVVREGIDSLLFEADNAGELAGNLRRLLREPSLLSELRAAVQPPRTMHDVAKEMRPLYEQLSALKCKASPNEAETTD